MRNICIAALVVGVVGLVSGRVCGAELSAEGKRQLGRALTLHVSFDESLAADFSVGDKTCYNSPAAKAPAAAVTEDVVLVPEGGRFGGALRFKRKNALQPAFKDGGVLGYNDKCWSTTVSVWLRLDPDRDLEPGYCDPVQIVGNDGNKGFIFLEWSKDEKPRLFRYAIRPLVAIWNPTNVAWDQIPVARRPLVQVERAPFSRDAWTHVAFTVENANDKTKTQRGRLYLNGQRQGQIENWDLTLGWDPQRVMLVLGAAYVGDMDDLAVFNRALEDEEVKALYGLKGGAGELRE